MRRRLRAEKSGDPTLVDGIIPPRRGNAVACNWPVIRDLLNFWCSASVSLGAGRDDDYLHLKVASSDPCSVSAWIAHFNLFWIREVCDELMEFCKRRWCEVDGRERV